MRSSQTSHPPETRDLEDIIRSRKTQPPFFCAIDSPYGTRYDRGAPVVFRFVRFPEILEL